MQSCLVITYGPVPTTQYQTVEGGGMRAWGIAKGLQRNNIEVTVAVNDSFPQELDEHENIKLVTWSLNDKFAELINSFDAVIVSYCMGNPSVFIADRINDNVQLILDAYVPIYVEVSARESKDIDTEYRNYMGDIVRFNHVLKRGDYFLCASQSQKTFYTGVLSSLGIINPRSYREDRILVVPFGIHDEPLKISENPYKNLGIKDSDFVVLWFGGLYPWFHVEELLESMDKLSKYKDIKFVFVGGKNPFNPNPDFFRQYEKTVKFADDKKLIDKSIYFIDWVDFDERVNWYVHADTVISLNQPGEENAFSWRTRVMDYVWGELAIITNGGDPLSETLLSQNAAIRLPQLSSNEITNTILSVHDNSKILEDVRKQVKQIKKTFYWHTIVEPIVQYINQHTLPYTLESAYMKKHGIGLSDPTGPSSLSPIKQGKVGRVISAVPKTISYARRKGIRSSVKLASDIAVAQFTKRKSRARQYVFIAHPMDNTGAPLVLMQIIEEYAKKYGGNRVRLIAPVVLPDHQVRLKKLGVRVEKAAHGLNFRMIRLQLGLRRNDFVMINTIAIYDNYREFILLWLKTSRLKHAYWFIHEDEKQIPVVNPTFLAASTLHKIQNLIKQQKLTVLTPSERTRQEYTKILDSKEGIKTIPLHVEVDKKYTAPRKAKDYSQLEFLLSGTPSDGRKGQLLALAAFQYYLDNFYSKSPKTYRDFKLRFVSIKDDYISQQIKWISNSVFGKQVIIYPQVSKDEAMEITRKCNAVICCSLNETFALYVAEGMLMGHVVLRNNSAGIDEQLRDGVNGYFIDHHDIKQFAGVIEKLLNRTKTSDSDLQKMGEKSRQIINDYAKNGYLETISQFKS